MRHNQCPIRTCTEDTCPPYLRQCSAYTKLMLARAVQLTGINFTSQVQDYIPATFFNTTSEAQALATLITVINRKPLPIKVLRFHSSVEAGLQPDLPTEKVIFINSKNNYYDAAKQYQVIASLISKCEEAGKLVIHVHKTDFK